MKATEALADAYGRIHEVVHDVVEGLSAEELNARIDRRRTRSPGWCGT